MIRTLRKYHDELVQEAMRTHIIKGLAAVQRRIWPLCIATLVLCVIVIGAPGLPRPLKAVLVTLVFVLAFVMLGLRIHEYFVIANHARREFPNPDDYY